MAPSYSHENKVIDHFLFSNNQFEKLLSSSWSEFYSDQGVFTTLSSNLKLSTELPCHIERLREDAYVLGIQSNALHDAEKALHKFIEVNSYINHTIKIAICKDKHNSGNELNILVQIRPFEPWPKSLKIKLGHTRLPRNKKLAGIKQTDRQFYNKARKEIKENDQYDDVLLIDSKGFVIESSIANIFWLKNDVFYTPCLKYCGVNGLTRRRIINYLQHNNEPIIINNFRESELHTAQQVWLCNAVKGIQSVEFIDNNSFPVDHKVTERLLNL